MVNANHARPLVAFWLLAAVAAVITVTGLRADHSSAPTLASPAPVTSSGAPELVLGGVLRSQSDSPLIHPLAPQLWGPDPTSVPSGRAVQVASPSGPTTTQKARTKTDGGQQPGTTQTHPSQATTEPVSTRPGNGHDRGRGKSDQPAKTTITATATDSPRGRGKGRP